MIFKRLSGRFGAGEIGLRLRDRDFVVLRVDFDQHGVPFCTYWLSSTFTLITYPEIRALTGIKMNINLGIVGGFVTVEISPKEHAAHNHRQGDNDDAKMYLRRFERVYRRGDPEPAPAPDRRRASARVRYSLLVPNQLE